QGAARYRRPTGPARPPGPWRHSPAPAGQRHEVRPRPYVRLYRGHEPTADRMAQMPAAVSRCSTGPVWRHDGNRWVPTWRLTGRSQVLPAAGPERLRMYVLGGGSGVEADMLHADDILTLIRSDGVPNRHILAGQVQLVGAG